MRISDLIDALNTVLAESGDLEVVSGLARSGYGEPVVTVMVREAGSFEGVNVTVADLELSDDSSCAIGGF